MISVMIAALIVLCWVQTDLASHAYNRGRTGRAYLRFLSALLSIAAAFVLLWIAP